MSTEASDRAMVSELSGRLSRIRQWAGNLNRSDHLSFRDEHRWLGRQLERLCLGYMPDGSQPPKKSRNTK